MTPLQLTRSVRSLARLREIARVLTRHGFGHIVERVNLGRFVPLRRLRGPQPPELQENGAAVVGRRLTRALSDLGPTFVKLGQVLTTRPDLIPNDTIKELRTLQDQVAPFDTDAARKIIEDELGSPIDECFARFDNEPLASGSIGQVYRATTTDGMEVVVKVKRPGVEHTVQLDMHILAWLAEALERFVPETAVYRPTQLVEEFSEAFQREMDYVGEASATTRVGEALADDEHIHVPRVRWDLCGARVLTLEAVQGQNLDTLLASGDRRLDRPALAKRLADAYLKQFFEVGVFHADPHPGNILVTPPASVGLIDFGQVGTLSDELATQFLIMIMAAVNREPEVIVDVLDDMDALGPDANQRQLARAIRLLLDKYYGLPLKWLDPVTILSEIGEVLRKHDVSVPRNLVLLIKTLTTMASVATNLDPDLDLLGLLKPRMRKLIANRLAPPQLFKRAGITLWQTLGVLRSAPGNIKAILRHLARGQWQLNVRHENLDRLTRELDRSSNRLALSVVLAAIIVGSSVVVSAQQDIELFGFISLRTVGVFGYVIAGVLGLGLVWAIFRSGRLY